MSGKDDDSEWDPNPVHVALMGDPTLRMHVVPPPVKVVLTKTDEGILIKWQKPSGPRNMPDGDIAYLVYRAVSEEGPYVRLTKNPIKNTQFMDSSTTHGKETYLVKTYLRQTSASGTYFNSSQGVFVEVRDL